MTKYSYENVDAALSAAIEMLRHIQGGGHYDAFDFYARMNALQEVNDRKIVCPVCEDGACETKSIHCGQ